MLAAAVSDAVAAAAAAVVSEAVAAAADVLAQLDHH
jgi:hypothetical protein